jgi:Calcineurin-like phosphoesterase
MLWLLLATLLMGQTPSVRQQVWLGMSDIHLDPFDRSPFPSRYGEDANPALFYAALAQMKRAVPNPALVLLPGDFFAHHFARRARAHPGAGTPDAAGIATMRQIALALARTFPHAQFAIALGNNDAPCGDYRSTNGSAYLAAVTRIWEPLVNRGGAAPGFASSFARGGYYTAKLPLAGLRLIVLNTIAMSTEYAGNCGDDGAHSASAELTWLQSVLRSPPDDERNVVVMHIPPGFDAFATEYVHGFVAWRFLKTSYDTALVDMLTAPANRVAYAIAGHAHRFDFRLAGDVPIIVLGSISPIYDNNPAFYALHVDGNSLRDIDVFTFDNWTQAWTPARSFARTWGVGRMDAAALSKLHERLAFDPAMRARWDEQANGWPSYRVLRPTWTRWWRVPWCAQNLLTPDFDDCAGIARRVEVARTVLAAGGLAVAVLLAVCVVLLLRRRGASAG